MTDQPGEPSTTTGALAAALEREHREIDSGIEVFLTGQAEGQPPAQPLRQALSALRRHIFLATGRMPEGWVCARAGAENRRAT